LAVAYFFGHPVYTFAGVKLLLMLVVNTAGCWTVSVLLI